MTNQVPDQNSAILRNYEIQKLNHEAHQKGSLSYHTNTRYGNMSNNFCYSCHKYGHRAVECDVFEKKIQESSSEKTKCGRCKLVGNTTKFCHSIRCFKCEGFGHKAQNFMNPKTQYNQKEDAPKSQGKDLKRDNIQTQEDNMPHNMSLKMESKQIFKNSRETSPKRNIKKVWRPKTRGCKSHAKTGDSYE